MRALIRFSLHTVVSFLLPVSAAFAQVQPQTERQTEAQALQWLQRIYSATQKLSYTGTFVYKHGDEMETSRITRYVDASGPYERLESLGGTPREIIRSRDQVTCYLPDSMTVKIDKQVADRSFPAILPVQVRNLTDSYSIRKGEIERVAGYDCQVIVFSKQVQLCCTSLEC